MDWEKVTLTTVGFGLYCLALILRSTSLRHLRFARLVDLAQIQGVSPRYRTWMQHGSLVLALVIMGAALWQTINTDRSAFRLLAGLAGMLIAVRLLGFFFTRVSLIVIEIETDPSSKLSFAHLRRSPFILGGLALLAVSLAAPLALDGLLKLRFDSFRQQEWQALKTRATHEGFAQNYIPRSLRMKGRAQYETEFFSRALLPGHRVVIRGRAGVGKSWFLTQLRFWFHEKHPDTMVILVSAKDLQPGEDLYSHVTHNIAGNLAWGARPYTRQVMASALVLIDGLDEVHSLNRDEAVRVVAGFVQDPANAQGIVVLTTRPTDLQPLLQSGFEVAEFPALMASESEKVLANPDRMAKLTATLRERLAQGHLPDASALRQFAPGQAPDWARLGSDQTRRLYRAFIDHFGFSVRLTESSGERTHMPFLSTYRDIDIVEELFLGTVAPPVATPPRAPDVLRTALIEQFLRRRIELNYHAAPEDGLFPPRVLDALSQECSDYLRAMPQATTFRFDRRRFERGFDGTTLDKVLLESELLVEQQEGERLVFDNPVLDAYFLTRSRRARAN